jgi:hypothetical protein
MMPRRAGGRLLEDLGLGDEVVLADQRTGVVVDFDGRLVVVGLRPSGTRTVPRDQIWPAEW